MRKKLTKTRTRRLLKLVGSAMHGATYHELDEANAALGPENWKLREALLLYRKAWNGCKGNWHAAMNEASKNADHVLCPNARNELPARTTRKGTI